MAKACEPKGHAACLRDINTEKLNEIHQIYSDLKFCTGSCQVTWDKEKQKKIASSMPNLEQRKKSQGWRYSDNMIYIIPENSGITVIDVDDIAKCTTLTKLCCTYCKFVV